MNNNKTMKYNKTQEINYKKKRMGLFLWGNLGVSLIRGLCEWRGIHRYIDTKMLTSQMHYFCSTAEPENKRRPVDKGNLARICFPFPRGQWKTKRMHAHVNSPSASAGKPKKKKKSKKNRGK